MQKKTNRPELQTVSARNRAAWRRWLERHHAKARGVVLVYAKKGSAEASIDWAESVDEALCFGWVDGVRGKLDETHFTVRFTPRKSGSLWSKRNLARIAHLTEAGLMHPAGLRAFELGKARGAHERAYAIREEVAMPPELDAELRKRDQARAAFEALARGQKKGWYRWIAGAKREATRMQRARDALLLIAAGRKAGETDNQAARRGVPTKARILGRTRRDS
ncbi:MAG TPA: YdeI/OmpD-associated family protein [Polyangiaceae bacterium]|nr:YdeI/OmpD-associated family protein [Polyangiaceae bacterium]